MAKGVAQTTNEANRVNGSSGGNQVRERRYAECTARRMGKDCRNPIGWWHYKDAPERAFKPTVCADCTAKAWARQQRTQARREAGK